MGEFYVGDWVHVNGYCPGFFKILKITDDGMELTGIGSVPRSGARLSECKLTPFNASQLQELVGKVVHRDNDAFLVLSATGGSIIVAHLFDEKPQLTSLSAFTLMESYLVDERGLPLCNIEKA